ncbi:DUF1028 domain-containing protein [Nitriliruptoraceae bacterium ZYF776]|nr:DUF1028 domain-containing protein [Profundirhabdus halotolerans]
MTFSIVAHCPRTDQVGVAAMTAMPGVGKLVAHARSNRGAAASQAMMNPYLAFDGLQLVGEGLPAVDVLELLVSRDPGREGRQFGLVDARGGAAAHTGSLPEDWKGHRTEPHLAAQGNRLAGPEVLDDAVAAYHAHDDGELAHRLLAALRAGEAAGGDTLGHRSATLTVMATELYPLWDLRIDDEDDPLASLEAEFRTFEEELVPQIRELPTRLDALGGFDYEGNAGAV